MKKLRSKKGFTLVEMIVVIAIIGVLAAILIPTMVGYVVRAHVADINSTAGKMRDNVSYFMTQAGSEGYGMFRTSTAICDVTVTVVNKEWTVTTSTQSCFLSQYATMWTGSGTADIDKVVNIQNAEERMASYFANTFREVEKAYCEFRLVGGVCHALYFTDEQSTPMTDMPPFGAVSEWDTTNFMWKDGEIGISPDGIIVGTSPVIVV